jgi:hypothetical protein
MREKRPETVFVPGRNAMTENNRYLFPNGTPSQKRLLSL